MVFLYIAGAIVVIIMIIMIKSFVWNRPHEEIKKLRKDMERIQELHSKEITQLQIRLQNSNSLHVQENEFADIVVFFAWQELLELCNKEYAFLGIPRSYSSSDWKKDDAIEPIKRRFREAIDEQYK